MTMALMTMALMTMALMTIAPMALKGGNLIDDRAGCSLIICLVINRSVINPPELLSLLPGEYSPVKVSLTKQVDSSHQSQ